MPALYSRGVRDALVEVQVCLEPNKLLLAYLDDVYIVARADCIRFFFDHVALWRRACVRLSHGRTRV